MTGVPALWRTALSTALVLVAAVGLSRPALAEYGLTGTGTASGRGDKLIQPNGLVWTTKSGTCVKGGDLTALVSFIPPQKGVEYRLRLVQSGFEPSIPGNYPPLKVTDILPGVPIKDYVVTGGAAPRLVYMVVTAKIGNWVKNSYAVGCTPTKPGEAAVPVPHVIPIWGLPPGVNPNLPPKPTPRTAAPPAGTTTTTPPTTPPTTATSAPPESTSESTSGSPETTSETSPPPESITSTRH